MKTIKIFKDVDTDELEINVNSFIDELKDQNPKLHFAQDKGYSIVMIEYIV